MKKNVSHKKEAAKSTIHEINNLLTSCHLSIEMILNGSCGKVSNLQRKYLKGAIAEGRKIKKLVKRIGDMSGNID